MKIDNKVFLSLCLAKTRNACEINNIKKRM